MLPPVEFAEMLGAKKTSSGWQANCPAHDDSTASLSIAEGDDGRLLVHCHAGCEFHDIIEATETYTPRTVPAKAATASEDFTSQIVHAYNYHDLDGVMRYQVVRLEPKSFRQRRPDGIGGWINNMKGVVRIPYRLPEWHDADPKRTVIFVEGEKDADTICDLGLLGTAIMGGASAWRGEMATWFADRKVVIIPDNDEPGEKFATAVYTSLSQVAASVKIVRLPGLPDKGDVSDWVAAGGTKDELVAIIKATPEGQDKADWKLEQQLAQSEEDFELGESLAEMVEARARQLETGISGIEYVSTGFGRYDRKFGGIETNLVTILGARPGIGKSTALCVLAIAAAKAGTKVLWLSLEDSPLRTTEKILAHEYGSLYAEDDAKQVTNPQRFSGYKAPPWLHNIRIDQRTNDVKEISAMIRLGLYKLVLVDYAQKLKTKAGDSEVEHGRSVIDELNLASHEGDCAVVLAAQVKRGGGETVLHGELQPPTMSDLRGSGFWEQGAKAIILIHRDTMQVRPPMSKAKREKQEAEGSFDNGLGPNEMLWSLVKSNFSKTGHLVMDIDLASCRIEDHDTKRRR